MEFISSDTNIWIDFSVIDCLELPFKLDYTYLMSQDAIDDELLSPIGLGNNLISLGLIGVELSEEEFYLAVDYSNQHARLSKHDCAALAIAKTRGIILLTGDGHLRCVAKQEGVRVMGTIGLLDQLIEYEYINNDQYVKCLKSLQRENGRAVRLPGDELEKRIKKYEEDL
jgi:predicted nucleic acid-binding protein